MNLKSLTLLVCKAYSSRGSFVMCRSELKGVLLKYQGVELQATADEIEAGLAAHFKCPQELKQWLSKAATTEVATVDVD